MNMSVTITFDPGVDDQQDVVRRVAQAFSLAPDADVLAGPRVQDAADGVFTRPVAARHDVVDDNDAADGWWDAATTRTWSAP